MTDQASRVCVFPSCAGFGTPLAGSFDRFCPICARPLGGATVGLGPGFRVDSFLGSGYYADVFAAFEMDTHEMVATKIYRGEAATRQAAGREIDALRTFAHPRLPTFKAAFEDGE